MSVAALIDAGFNTSGAQVKPTPSGLPQFSLTPMATARHPSDTPPLMPTPPLTAPMTAIIKSEPLTSGSRSSPAPLPEQSNNSSTRSPPMVDVKPKLEPLVAPPSQPTGNGSNNLKNSNANNNPSSNSAKPVYKLKTAWLQRTTGELTICCHSSCKSVINGVEFFSFNRLRAFGGYLKCLWRIGMSALIKSEDLLSPQADGLFLAKIWLVQ